jgi:RNA polymerase sigma factor (sigma-70 family)
MSKKNPAKTRPEEDGFVQVFAANVANALTKYEKMPVRDPDALLQRQTQQMNLLVDLEDRCRKALIQDARGLGVYERFAAFIREERRNALAAQPYFREPEGIFIKEISPAIRDNAVRSLLRYHFNYAFVAFARRIIERDWVDGLSTPFWKLSDALIAARRELVETNLPLAISRARMFYGKTPKSHMDYLDFVQLAVEGLLAAIDKFRLPFRPVFRSVAIGRMTALFIERYSETTLRFYPLDRRRIYRANKALRRTPPDQVDYGVLAESVNQGLEERYRTSPEDLACLMSAVSMLSVDWQEPGGGVGGSEEGRTFGDGLAAPEENRPDRKAEEKENGLRLQEALKSLDVLESKVVKMAMGLDF